MDQREKTLKEYEVYIPDNETVVEKIFWIVLVIITGTFVTFGVFLHSVKILPEPIMQKIHAVKTQFVLEEEKKQPVAPKPKPEKKTVPAVKEAPVDLTKAPKLGAKQDDLTPSPAQPNASTAPRRVYGLRRVYSVGIGSGGSQSDAVVGKLGNTLNAPVDTVTATEKDLKGTLVPVSSITSAPRLLNFVKPEYTEEMKKARIEGVVKAVLLIDIDGKVKDVRIVSDIGYGTAEIAKAVFRKWLFEPAKRDDKPVAVYINYSIRFEMLE